MLVCFVWCDSLHPSQQLFSYVRMGLLGLNQFLNFNIFFRSWNFYFSTFSGTKIHVCWNLETYDPLKYKINKPMLIVSICMVKSIRKKRVNYTCNFCLSKLILTQRVHRYLSRFMRFPTMRYVRPAEPQISVRIRAVWSEPLLVTWVFYEC